MAGTITQPQLTAPSTKQACAPVVRLAGLKQQGVEWEGTVEVHRGSVITGWNLLGSKLELCYECPL